MTSNNKEYLDEMLYHYIDDLVKSSDKYKELSGTLKDRLSDLMESIDDDDVKEILSEIEDLNKYLTTVNNLSTNELTLIKNNNKKLIEKYNKHKKKIISLKSKNNMLEAELANINEQKEKALAKIDELNDEYYKLYKEKNNIEMNNSFQENEEKDRDKINNELLNEKIKDLNEKNDYLQKQINIYEEKIKDLSKKNGEIFEINTKLNEELEYKDKSLEILIQKNDKLVEENKNVMFMNSGLQKTIEVFENQFKENDKIMHQLKEQINYYEQLKVENNKNITALLNDEEEKNSHSEEILDDENEDGLNKSRRYGVDYNGMGINLNDLINDESESSEFQFHRGKTGLKSPIIKYKKEHEEHHITPKKSFKKFDNLKTKRTAANILIKLQNYRIENKNNNINSNKVLNKNDEAFLSELLFRLIDY